MARRRSATLEDVLAWRDVEVRENVSSERIWGPSRTHALCVCQGCQAACLARTGPTDWRLVYSFAVAFTHQSLCPSTVPTVSVAPFDYD